MEVSMRDENSKIDQNQLLSIGEISSRSGIPISALHFYERKGLIHPIRNKMNQRRFPRGILRILSLLKVAQRIGFSLEEISEMFLTLPSQKKPNQNDWKRLSKQWKKKLDEKIDYMLQLRDQLDNCIGCGCLSMKVCPLRNPNDKLAKKGSGPILLDQN